jgi:hypothetical protein
MSRKGRMLPVAGIVPEAFNPDSPRSPAGIGCLLFWWRSAVSLAP